MNNVRAKKYLGQHFLRNDDIAFRIADALPSDIQNVLEIGPGMGVLTKHLCRQAARNLRVVEIDGESVDYLLKNGVLASSQVIAGDFLRLPIDSYFNAPFAVIGNFPYNISSQILFRVLEHKNSVPVLVGMFQKEVAERLASGPGGRDYGILSVFLQAYYDIEYLFTVAEHEFIPPPKVKSGVIRMKRNSVQSLDCDEKFFVTVVKQAFNQRRKTLRNSLKSLLKPEDLGNELLNKRPEQLGVSEFVYLTNMLSK